MVRNNRRHGKEWLSAALITTIFLACSVNAGDSYELLGGYAANESDYAIKLVTPVSIGATQANETYAIALTISPSSSALSGNESGYTLEGNIYTSGVGGILSELGYSIYMTPEQSFTSQQSEITAYDEVTTTTTTTSTTTTTTYPYDGKTCPKAFPAPQYNQNTSAELYYQYTLNDSCDVSVTMSPASDADYDLYAIWNGSCPQTTAGGWDCRPYSGGGVTESCVKTSLTNGTYYLLVDYYVGAGTFNITVETGNCLGMTTTTTTTTTTTSTTTTSSTTSTTSTTTIAGATTTSSTTTTTSTSTTTTSSTTTTVQHSPNILINEFLPHPAGSQQEWIELYNNESLSVKIGGLQLADAPGGSSPYTIPNLVIQPKNFMLFYKNETNLTLGDLGDTVRLLSTYGSVIDSYTYYTTQRGKSIGRETDGWFEWTIFDLPTPGFTNAGLNDTNPPSVSLDNPENNAVDTDGNIFLEYTPTDLSTIANCVLYTNVSGGWQITQLDTTILVNAQNSFGLFGLANGTYLWNVQCTDQTSLSASAPLSRIFIVRDTADIFYSTFVNASLNATTNVSSPETNTTLLINVTENVSNASVIIASYANDSKISNLSVPNVGKYISIESNTELEESVSNIVLRIYYTHDELSAANISEGDLVIYWFDGSSEAWVALNPANMTWVNAVGVNTDENYVWADVQHFSDYAVAAISTQSEQIQLVFGWNLVSLPLFSSS